MRRSPEQRPFIEQEPSRHEAIEPLYKRWNRYLEAVSTRDSEQVQLLSREIRCLLDDVADEVLVHTPESYTPYIDERDSLDEMSSRGEFVRSFEGADLVLKDGVLRMSARTPLGEVLVRAFSEVFGEDVRDTYDRFHPSVGVILAPKDSQRGRDLLVRLKEAYTQGDEARIITALGEIRDAVASRSISFQDTRQLSPAQKQVSHIEYLSSLGSGTGGQRLLLVDGVLKFPSQSEGLSRELQDAFMDVFGELVQGPRAYSRHRSLEVSFL